MWYSSHHMLASPWSSHMDIAIMCHQKGPAIITILVDTWYSIIIAKTWSQKQTLTTMMPFTIITVGITTITTMVTLTLAVMSLFRGIEDTIVDITMVHAVGVVMEVVTAMPITDAVGVDAAAKEVVKTAPIANHCSNLSKSWSMSQQQLRSLNSSRHFNLQSCKLSQLLQLILLLLGCQSLYLKNSSVYLKVSFINIILTILTSMSPILLNQHR